MKNVLIYALVLILALPVCFGATASLSPITAYEAVDADYSLDVSNYQSNVVVNKIVLDSPLAVQDVVDFAGWTASFSSSQITWSDGTLEGNVKSASFEYTATSPIIAEDTIKEITGTIFFDDTTTQDFKINVTILNDITPPVLISSYPADGSYARAYRNDQPIKINTSDPETGISSVKYFVSDCTNNATEVILACAAGYCEGTADFTNYGEADTACFSVVATNKAGDSSTTTGSFGFDNTPPTVNLLSPLNNSYATASTMFSFDVADNKANEFTCTVSIDNADVRTLDAFTGLNAFAINSTITEGQHSWKVSCIDAVDLMGTDSDGFTYDITAPNILLNSPSNGSAIKDSSIDIAVSDNYEVSDVDYSSGLDSSTWPVGWNTLTVTATDAAGNTAVKDFQFYVDRTAPVIEVISPLDTASLDYHGLFTIKATDDFDLSLDCTLNAGAANPVSSVLESGVESTITSTLPLGAFTWTVSCTDDLGNTANTAVLNAIAVDLTGPDISLGDLTYIARGSDITVTATITDISGIKNAYAVFDGNTIALSASGDTYTGTYTTSANMAPGVYTVEVFATDNNDLTSSATDSLTIVENYNIVLNVPATATPSSTVSISGSVAKDDSSIASGHVTITHPAGATDVALDANGAYSLEFAAPSSIGTYDVKVSYETAELVYSKTKQFSVAEQILPQAHASHGLGDLSANYQAPVHPAPEVTAPSADSNNQEASASELVTPPEAPAEIPAEEPRTPGVGRATGVFDLLGKTAKWWIIIITAIGLIGGSAYAFYKSRKGRKDSGISWGDKFS